ASRRTASAPARSRTRRSVMVFSPVLLDQPHASRRRFASPRLSTIAHPALTGDRVESYARHGRRGRIALNDPAGGRETGWPCSGDQPVIPQPARAARRLPDRQAGLTTFLCTCSMLDLIRVRESHVQY